MSTRIRSLIAALVLFAAAGLLGACAPVASESAAQPEAAGDAAEAVAEVDEAEDEVGEVEEEADDEDDEDDEDESYASMRARHMAQGGPGAGMGRGMGMGYGQDAMHRAMLEAALSRGLIEEGDVDLFLEVHAAIEPYMSKSHEGRDASSEAKMSAQRAFVIVAQEDGAITEAQGERFTEIHDILIESGIMDEMHGEGYGDDDESYDDESYDDDGVDDDDVDDGVVDDGDGEDEDGVGDEEEGEEG